MRKKLFIGIDPGVSTGFAVCDPAEKSLVLSTILLHEGFEEVKRLNESHDLVVVIEDPNLWTYFKGTKNAKARLQGAGSVKRDYSAWRDFLTSLKIPFKAVQPNKTRNAWADDPALFRKLTGYAKKSSKHARVAALLVWRK